MKQDFDYAYDYVATAQLQLDSIGNTCIKAVNDLGDTWYLIVDTQLGVTNLTTFGPLYLEGNQIQKTFSFYRDTFDYNENYKKDIQGLWYGYNRNSKLKRISCGRRQS